MATAPEPDAGWPMYAAAVWCEAYLGGSHKHVMALKFLTAPDKDNATRGAIRMMRGDYPHGSNFEALVSVVPAQAMTDTTKDAPSHG